MEFKTKFGFVVYRQPDFRHIAVPVIATPVTLGYYYIQTLTPKTVVYIDGIKAEDMEFPTELQRLPKGWNYDTQLFKYEKEYVIDPKTPLCNSEDIAKLYNSGALIERINSFDACYKIEDCIGGEKQGFWNLVKNSRSFYETSRFPDKTVYESEIYETLEAAKAFIRQKEAEQQYIANMTDEEYADYEINNICDWLLKSTSRTPDDIEAVKTVIHKMDEWWDFDFRRGHECLEWRKPGRKKWNQL